MKPCPFCGEMPETETVAMSWRTNPRAYVNCGNIDCPVSVEALAETIEQAIKLWNTRANPWQPMETAPKDREILVYVPKGEGLPAMYCPCKWHPDAGFTVDALREPAQWTELP